MAGLCLAQVRGAGLEHRESGWCSLHPAILGTLAGWPVLPAETSGCPVLERPSQGTMRARLCALLRVLGPQWVRAGGGVSVPPPPPAQA